MVTCCKKKLTILTDISKDSLIILTDMSKDSLIILTDMSKDLQINITDMPRNLQINLRFSLILSEFIRISLIFSYFYPNLSEFP